MKNIMKRNQTYQFRVVIPDYAVIYFPQKKLLIKSMGTKSKSVALKYSKILMEKYKYILESIKMGMSIETIQSLVEDFLSLRLQETEQDLYNSPDPANTLFYFLLDEQIKKYQVAMNTQKYNIVKKDIETISNSISYELDNSDIENMSKALLQVQINHLKQIRIDIENNKYRNPNPNISNQKIELKKVHTLEKTFDEFIRNTTISMKWTNDTVRLCEATRNIMILYFSNNTNIENIKRNQLIEFRNMLFNLQTKFLQKNHLKNKSLDFILEDSKDKDKLSENTVNKYMLRVTQFFTYCYENDYIQKNIATNLKIKSDKIDVEKKRESYTIDEVKTIKEIIKNENDEIQIITMMCMFQGMRLNEICQLTTKDIINIDGIYCIDINNKNGKKVKTSNSIRTIPIHSSILNDVLSFISLKTDKIFNIDNKKFSEYYRKKIHPKITNDDKKSLYSLRHNFIDSLLQNDVKIEIIASLAGHAQEYSITMNTYANKVNVNILKEAIEKIQY